MAGSKNAKSVLKRRQRALYGAPYLGYAVANFPVAAFIPAFYASERGLALASVGLMLALTRIADVVTDPVVGWISDKIRMPIGRRKPLILLGLPLLCLSVWMLYVPPEGAGLTHVFIWASLLYLGFTLVDVPFKSFGAELSPDYDERAELAGWREGLGLVGTLLGLAAAIGFTRQGDGTLGEQLFILAVIGVVATPLLFGFTLGLLKEPAAPNETKRNLPVRAKFRIMWQNGAYRRLLFVSLILLSSLFGATAIKALVLEHVYDAKELFPVLLLAELIVMVSSMPFWLWAAKKWSKHQVVAVASVWGGMLSLALPFVASGSVSVFFGIAVLQATSTGALTVLLNGMAADVVDLDTARTGEVRTGIYFAFWGTINKGAVALGVLVATSLPAMFGYQVTETSVNGSEALLWIYGLMPAIGLLGTAPLIAAWPITRARQTRLRALIDRRASRMNRSS